MMGFVHWVVSLQNQLVAMWERRDAEARKAFKAEQDAKFMARKQALHQKTAVQFGNAQKKVDLLHEDNLRKGLEVKRDMEYGRQAVAEEREAWIQHGHELVASHGKQQLERTKSSIAECVAEKAEHGRRVRVEGQQHGKEIYIQRSKDLVHKRENVTDLKNEASGKVEESMVYAYDSRRKAVQEVQKTVKKWKRNTELQRDSFRAHATDNHKTNDKSKEHARQVHTDLVKANNDHVKNERQLKEAHTGQVAQKRTAAVSAKKAVRDAVFSARFISQDKTKLMRDAKHGAPSSDKIELVAKSLGLLENPPPVVSQLPSSPYRLGLAAKLSPKASKPSAVKPKPPGQQRQQPKKSESDGREVSGSAAPPPAARSASSSPVAKSAPSPVAKSASSPVANSVDA